MFLTEPTHSANTGTYNFNFTVLLTLGYNTFKDIYLPQYKFLRPWPDVCYAEAQEPVLRKDPNGYLLVALHFLKKKKKYQMISRFYIYHDSLVYLRHEIIKCATMFKYVPLTAVMTTHFLSVFETEMVPIHLSYMSPLVKLMMRHMSFAWKTLLCVAIVLIVK